MPMPSPRGCAERRQRPGTGQVRCPGLRRAVGHESERVTDLPPQRLVGHVCQWTLEEGQGLREEHRVAVHDAAPELVQWLKEDNAGFLDAPRKRAWIGACQAWPGLKREAVERVD